MTLYMCRECGNVQRSPTQDAVTIQKKCVGVDCNQERKFVKINMEADNQ